jgi:hypothetical protein
MELFTQHPAAVGMTYMQHGLLSLSLSRMFLVGAVQAFVHAIFPFFFEKGSTEQNEKIRNTITETRRR